MYLNIFIPIPETNPEIELQGLPYHKSVFPLLITEREAEPYNKLKSYLFLPSHLIEYRNKIDLVLTEELMMEE